MNFISPQSHISTLELSPGDIVLDAGAGSGAYTIAVAESVTARGIVYAVDIHKDLLARVHSEAHAKGLEHVQTLWGNIESKEGIPLENSIVDAALLCNTLFMLEDKNACMEEVRRVLKVQGKLLIVDWSDSHGGVGPHVDHVVTEKDARTLCEAHGFRIARPVDGAAHHYGFVAVKV